MTRKLRRAARGQAMVETALTLPLVLFMVLGLIQLSLAGHARMMAHYAAFKATRAGSVNYGDCARMTQAALAAIVPSVTSFMAPGIVPGGTPAARYVEAFRQLRERQNGNIGGDPPPIWIYRERPLPGDVILATGQNNEFDQPTAVTGTPENQRLEVRLVYWYRMNIPFVNWTIASIVRTQYGFAANPTLNPITPVASGVTDWTDTPLTPPEANISAEMNARMLAGLYDLPIIATYTMRMFTPAKASYFATQNCPPTPP